MEHILASNIMSLGENNNILYPLQHGFRRARSSETQLIEFIDDLTSNQEEGQQTDILIMDFAKAFDKVDHSLLIHKLHHYGIRGEVNTWIKNWLKDRTQSVIVEREKSEPSVWTLVFPKVRSLAQGCFQGWAEHSTPRIYRWNLPVFPGMANKAPVANTGKYNFFCCEILTNMIFSCKMQQISLGS